MQREKLLSAQELVEMVVKPAQYGLSFRFREAVFVRLQPSKVFSKRYVALELLLPTCREIL